MDMAETIAPKSDQLNSDDLMSGERTFTISSVSKGSAEQPVAVRLVEFPDDRPYYPCKSMRRVMVTAWGRDAADYVGRRLTLYRDPDVKWAGQAIGGIRIRAMSHIDKPMVVALTETRGKRAPFRVQPLPAESLKPAGSPLGQRIEAAVSSFALGGVTLEQLERRVGTERGQWTADDLAGLQVIFESLKAKKITKEEAFPAPAEGPADDTSPETLPIPDDALDPDVVDPPEWREQ